MINSKHWYTEHGLVGALMTWTRIFTDALDEDGRLGRKTHAWQIRKCEAN